jgi:hypothetical protein
LTRKEVDEFLHGVLSKPIETETLNEKIDINLAMFNLGYIG